MAQIKIYGDADHLNGLKRQLSDTLHSCVVDTLELPAEKRFHRFILLPKSDFIYPDDRSEKYTIIEIDMFEGRAKETKKSLVRSIFERFDRELKIRPQDVEVTIHESPKENWGIRGLPADELKLNYKIEK